MKLQLKTQKPEIVKMKQNDVKLDSTGTKAQLIYIYLYIYIYIYI